MADKIKVRRGLKAVMPTLDEGEFGFCTDTKELYIGTDLGNLLVNGGTAPDGGGETGGTTISDVTNLTATPAATSVELTWTAVGAATSYEIHKDGTLLDTVTGTQYIALGLTTNTQYTFLVKAKNAQGTATGVSVQSTPTSTSGSTTVYASDSFTRANSTTTLGTDETGKVWSAYTTPNVYGIQNNQAYPVTPDLNDPIYIDAGVSDNIYFQIRHAVFDAASQIMWRITGKDDYMVLENNEAFRVVADLWSSRGTIPALTNGDLIRIELRGSEHKIFVNGILALTFTETAHQASTRFGFATSGTTARFDDFKVESLGASTATTNSEAVQVWLGGVE